MGKQTSARRLGENQSMAVATRLRTSAQKLNLVAEMIRGLDASDALSALSFSRRRIAGDVRKVLQSAIANAENNHDLDVDRLYVSEASVGKSITMKRWRARARGRTARIHKPFSKITVIVTEREQRRGKKK
jgi:large subunit ribosomal protein L22